MVLEYAQGSMLKTFLGGGVARKFLRTEIRKE
jgi:hypothetical protein